MSSASGQWSDLGPRLISGGIAAAIGLWVMWLGGYPFHFLVAVISGIMVWEIARMCGAGDKAVPYGASGRGGPFRFDQLSHRIHAALAVRAFAHRHWHNWASTGSAIRLFCAAVLIAGLGLVILRDNYGFRLGRLAGPCGHRL